MRLIVSLILSIALWASSIHPAVAQTLGAMARGGGAPVQPAVPSFQATDSGWNGALNAAVRPGWLQPAMYPALIPILSRQTSPASFTGRAALSHLEAARTTFQASYGPVARAYLEYVAELARAPGADLASASAGLERLAREYAPLLLDAPLSQAIARANAELQAAAALAGDGRREALDRLAHGIARSLGTLPETTTVDAGGLSRTALREGASLSPWDRTRAQATGASEEPRAPAEAKSPMQEPGFRWLLATQFLGVFNDNLMKSFVSLMVLGLTAHWGPWVLGGKTLLSIAGALMIFPFIPLSGFAGALADRVSKSKVIVGLSVAGVAIAAGFSAALLFPVESALPWLLGSLALMGAHSALYSPAKYGLVKQLLPRRLLSDGNGLIESITYLGIVLGLPAGGLLISLFSGAPIAGGIAIMAVALAQLWTAWKIPASLPSGGTQAYRPSLLWQAFIDLRDTARSAPSVFRTLLGIGFFWFLGALFLTDILSYAKEMLRFGDLGVSLVQTMAAVGIGAGAFIAGKLSRGRAELGFIPFGGLGIAAFAAALAFMPTSGLWVAAALTALVGLGLASGFFIIPLSTYLQEQTRDGETGRFIGLGNVLVGIAVFLGSAAFGVLSLAFTPAQIFWPLAASALAVNAVVLWRFPAASLRTALAALLHTIYKIRVVGGENIPADGKAVLAANHVSMIDAAFVNAATHRNVRFIMDRGYYEASPRVFSALRAIPISSRREDVVNAFGESKRELDAGHLVGIFPRGQMERMPGNGPYKHGVEDIAQASNAPIIPIHLDGLWGSIFSFFGGKYVRKKPLGIPYPKTVTVTVGAPLPPTASAAEVREKILELESEAFSRRLDGLPPLGRAFVDQVKANWSRLAMTDSVTGRKLSFGRSLVATILLGWTLQKMLPENKNVGVLIPPTSGAAITNLALTQIGRVPVNLSYVATPEQLQASIKKGELAAVIASRGLVEKFKIPVTPGMVFIEDIMKDVLKRKVAGALVLAAARLLPAGILSRLFMPNAPKSIDETATILFTTGSSGDPKGVELTHKNLLANIEGIREVFPFEKNDRILGSLPIFHAFGLTATLGLPLSTGFGAVYHTNPKEVEKIGELIQENQATFLATIPSLLPDFIAKVDASKLKSLRYVIVGAEKLEPAVQKAFEDKFGVPVLEGYGATELSPVATINVPDVRDGKLVHFGRKPGSAGRPLPGVLIRIVDPDDSTKILPSGSEGRILIKGPNVMKGYFKDPEKTAAVIKDGWYDTEDAGYVDEDGFLFIADRLNRIAKIKGEKVPMKLVEAELQEAAGLTRRTFLVVNPKDAAKVETLVVVYAGYDGPIEPLLEKLRAKGFKNVMIPAKERFMKVDALPTIGIGKADYKKVKKLAEERFGGGK